MTILPNKTTRDELNIDTHERAIIYAALLLREANTVSNDNPYYDNVLMTIVHTSSTIAVQAKILYDRQTSFENALNIPYNCLPFSNYDPGSLITNPCVANGTSLNEPNQINNLEKYLCYHSFRLLNRLLVANNSDAKSIVKITLNDKQKVNVNPYVTLDIALPFSYQDYLLTFNILCSVNKLVNPLTESVVDNNNSWFNNDYWLNNDSWLNNGV